jgi:hypothetical protein
MRESIAQSLQQDGVMHLRGWVRSKGAEKRTSPISSASHRRVNLQKAMIDKNRHYSLSNPDGCLVDRAG